MAAERYTTAGLLPPAGELSAAIHGRHIGAHALTRLAARLGVLHRRTRTCPHTDDECDCGRVELILGVDLWATLWLPRPRAGARLHTESLGAVLDRMARSQVHAFRLLMTLPPTDSRVLVAWYRAAELVDGYNDLADALVARAVRLPALGDGL